MKRIFFLILLFPIFAFSDTKISQLPLNSASNVGTSDSFPYVDATNDSTERLLLDDLTNLPAMATEFLKLIPSQVGQAGMFLTTNGTNTAWATGVPGSVGTIGQVVPSQADLAGASQGGVMQPLLVDSSGYLEVNPEGGATSANQTTGNTSLASINTNTAHLPTSLGQQNSAGSLPVVISSDQPAVPVSSYGMTSANAPVYNNYSSTNVTTSAYVQMVASTTSHTNLIDIFDSSGQAMILATGASGSEVVLAYVPPGGDQIHVSIPAGTRVAYKALTASATSGYLLMNFWE